YAFSPPQSFCNSPRPRSTSLPAHLLRYALFSALSPSHRTHSSPTLRISDSLLRPSSIRRCQPQKFVNLRPALFRAEGSQPKFSTTSFPHDTFLPFCNTSRRLY